MGFPRTSLHAVLGFGAVALALSAASPSAAQEATDTLRSRYLLPMPATIEILSTVGRSSPGSSSGSPTGYGASFGDGFVGAGYQQRTRYRDQNDGTMVVGFGLGNARDLIGLEVALTSVSTFRSGPFHHNTMSLKAHRALPGNFGVAVGWENAVQFSDRPDGGTSLYGAVSKVWNQDWWNPFSSVTTTLGVGNGRFRFEDDVTNDNETINVFGSVGVQIWEPVSLIADWTGQDLTLAASFVPFVRIPLVITPALSDVTGNAGDGVRFTLGAGMGFKFADIGRVIF